MPGDLSPAAVLGWLRKHGSADDLAGAAFLIGPDIVLTCAHVVRDHLGLPNPAPAEAPAQAVTIRFEAIQGEVSGQVVAGGWFSNARGRPGELWDVAVIRLAEQVQISKRPAIAQWMPAERRPVLIHGAESGYQSYGQQVPGLMAGTLPNGRRQIDPQDAARGFTVEQGFSGGPVLDDLGNVVLGMIAAVDAKGRGVAYAVPAEDLWRALQSAGVQMDARVPDAIDARLEQAMAVVREKFEAQLSSVTTERERLREEFDRLRQGVQRIGEEARGSESPKAEAALDALAEGDVRPATAELRHKMDQQFSAIAVAKRDAAATARQLGAMLGLVDARGALDAFHRVTECEPNDFWSWIEVARLERRAGTLGGATTAVEMSLRASEADDRSRSVALDELGEIRRAQGDLKGALAAYEQGLAIAERLAAQDTANTQWQRDLSVSHNKIGDVRQAQGDLKGALAAYKQGLAIAERLAAQDTANTEWQRDLSISHNRIGDVRQAQGDLKGALAAYEQSLAIRERLAAQDAANTEWQRDLSVSHNKIGDVCRAQGDLTSALAAYEQGLGIAERLAAQDVANTQWQRDLSISHDRIGDVRQAQDDLEGALAAYEQSLAIRERLAAQDAANTEWQRDLSISHDRIGDIRRAQGDLEGALAAYEQSLAIRERLAAQDAANTQLQRDLSISHDRIGDVRQAQDDLTGALAAYEQGLGIAERLAAQDVANKQWQRDLSVSHNSIGEIRQAQGDLKGALAACQQGLAIIERLAAQDATNAIWKNDLSYSKERVEELQKLIASKSKRKGR